jgi:transposase
LFFGNLIIILDLDKTQKMNEIISSSPDLETQQTMEISSSPPDLETQQTREISSSSNPDVNDHDHVEIRKRKTKEKRTNKRVSDEIRLHFIECAILNGIPAACKQFEIKESTARNWMKLWDPVEGFESIRRIKPGPVPGKRRKLTPEVISFINEKIEEDNSISGKKLAMLIEQQLGQKIGASTVNGYLASEGYTFKRAAHEDASRNTPVIIEERRKFAKLMVEKNLRPEDPSKIIYFDIS